MQKNVLITGAARRIGAVCARLLHDEGFNICLHYRSSEQDVVQLGEELNHIRADSARMIQADLLNMQEIKKLAQAADEAWGGVGVLLNNASAFTDRFKSPGNERCLAGANGACDRDDRVVAR